MINNYQVNYIYVLLFTIGKKDSGILILFDWFAYETKN